MNPSAVPSLIADEVLSYLSNGNDLSNSSVLGEVWKQSALRLLSQRGSCCLLVQYRLEKSFRLIYSHLTSQEDRKTEFSESSEANTETGLFAHLPHISRKEDQRAHLQGLIENFVRTEMQCEPELCFFFAGDFKDFSLRSFYNNSNMKAQAVQILCYQPLGPMRDIAISQEAQELTIRNKIPARYGIASLFSARHYSSHKTFILNLQTDEMIDMSILAKIEDYPLKCVLVFKKAKTPLRISSREKITKLLMSDQVAVGGCISDHILYRPGRRGKIVSLEEFVVAFLGKNIKVAKFVMDPEEEDFKRPKDYLTWPEKLHEFKKSLSFDADQCDRHAHTIGFMFTESEGSGLVVKVQLAFPNVLFVGSSQMERFSAIVGLKKIISVNNSKKKSNNQIFNQFLETEMSRFSFLLIHIRNDSQVHSFL
ncbi:uncharacterized protein LOC141858545 [Brevipalpus obovatus]|uniref:uncharacterized protein LOC141858545 n=1 Tax=Brevipalpus obovatus TaxID=246614 RepID=UPI003D9ED44B